MRNVTSIAIDHVVVESKKPYEAVKATLEQRLGLFGNTEDFGRQLPAKAAWGDIVRAIEQRLGPSGFAIFSKVEQGQLLDLAGKRGKSVQYAIGNPLLAIQMIEHAPEVGLYAPLRLVVYETRGKTFLAYDRFGSLLAQYGYPEIARVAQAVEQSLEALIADATGTESRGT